MNTTMRHAMIYGESLSFNKLIDKIKQLNERINRIDWYSPKTPNTPITTNSTILF